MTSFYPPYWKPLLEKIDEQIAAINALCACLGTSGGGTPVAAKHAVIPAYGWQWMENYPVEPGYLMIDPYSYLSSYSVDNPNVRRYTVALHLQPGGNYFIGISALSGPAGGIARLLCNGNLLVTYDLFDTVQGIAALAGIFGSDTNVDGLFEFVIECDSKNASSTGYEVPIGSGWIGPQDFT